MKLGKSNFFIVCLMHAIVLGLVNLLIFTIFQIDKITEAVAVKGFWINYGFLMFAFVIQFVTLFSLKAKNIMDKMFMNIPFFGVGAIYLAATLLVSLVFMIMAQFNVKVSPAVSVILQVILFGVYAFIALRFLLAKNYASNVDNEIHKAVTNFRDMASDVRTYAAATDNKELKAQLEVLADDIQYSDPMSNDSVAEIDIQIGDNLAAIGVVSTDNDVEEALQLIKKTRVLLLQRKNRLKDHK